MGTDVFIVGAGPAGLVAAIALRRKSREVIVADGAHYPIDKPCGEGLMPGAVQALDGLGIRFGTCGDGFRFRGIRFVGAARSVQAEFSNGAGVGIRRVELHRKLVQAAQEAGVQFLWNHAVTGIENSGVRAGGKFYRSKWIIGADGFYSRVAKWSGLRSAERQKATPQRGEMRGRPAPRYARQQHFRVEPWTDYVEIYWGKTSQAYVTPVASNEVNVVVTSEDPHARIEQLLKKHGDLRSKLGADRTVGPERGAVTATRRLRRVTRGNVLLLGDASGSVDAITGEGLRLGFEQAFAATEAICRGNLHGYEKAHGALFRRPVAMARLMLLLQDYPRLRRRVLEAFGSEPGIFVNLLRLHGGQASLGQTAATGVALGWRLLFAA